MGTLLAMLDNSLAASPVLAVARGLAPLLGCKVEAVHMLGDGDWVARQVAQAGGIALYSRRGPLVDSLVEAGEAAHVTAVVIGARGTPGGPRPLGSTAMAVATRLGKPLVVVPPDTPPDGPVRRVLVPVEGPGSPSPPPRVIVDLAETAEVDLVVLHVLEEHALPAVTDQPQHEWPAWGREFINRYCRWHHGALRLETRVGRARDLVPRVAEEVAADLVALGWSQELGPEHAPIVRGVLERCRRPVLLVPVEDPVSTRSDPGRSERRAGMSNAVLARWAPGG
jgi:nucleotide-binding universal stress UspA family protein